MILADTTVIIDLWRGKLGVKKCLEKHKTDFFSVSAITVEEIYVGLGYTKAKKGEDFFKEVKAQYERILGDYKIIPVNIPILKRVGLKIGILKEKGIVLNIADCIIGVTAELLKVKKIISRNPRHFKEFEVKITSYKI